MADYQDAEAARALTVTLVAIAAVAIGASIYVVVELVLMEQSL